MNNYIIYLTQYKSEYMDILEKWASNCNASIEYINRNISPSVYVVAYESDINLLLPNYKDWIRKIGTQQTLTVIPRDPL